MAEAWRLPCVAFALASISVLVGLAIAESPPVQNSAEQLFEDFSKSEADGFPQGWQASRSEAMTRQAYVVSREGTVTFLKTKGVDSRMRIFKRMSWDSKIYPIVAWRWRVRSTISGTEPVAALFISLDQDFFGIPVNTKYIWSPTLPPGTMVEGGFFRPTQIVLRSNQEKIGEWVEERVNAYEDFKRIHNHEPAAQAWGISLVTGPGVEVDFAAIRLAKR